MRGTQFLTYVLGCKAGKVSIFEYIIFTISDKANIKVEYTGSRPFLLQGCLLGGPITKVQTSTSEFLLYKSKPKA